MRKAAEQSALGRLIARARRRSVGHLLVAQAVWAGCFAMGGAIALLLAGTQILDWPWLGALFVSSFGVGAWRLSRRLPSPYQVAQRVDRNLKLDDTLSTAWFYGRNGRKADPEIVAAQRARAERLAQEADLRRAVPLEAPRALYSLLLLGLAASGLFALRYGITRTLDLRAALPTIVLDAFRTPEREETRARKRERRQPLQELLKQFGLAVEDPVAEGASEADSSLATPADSGEKAAVASGAKMPKPLELSLNQRQEGDGEGTAEDASGDQVGGSEADSPGGEHPSQQASNSAGENNSLLEKFREAMANLLSRLKSPPASGEPGMSASAQARQDNGQGRQGPGQKSSPGAGKQLADNLSNSASQSDEDAQGTPKASNAPGKRGGEDSDLQAAKEGRSGIGKEDGSKQLREAAQLAAMGKITEIFGKRSQNLSGEVMVEVASGKQVLKTPYSQQEAAHADAGGEIHRDEIPLAYQGYVQAYFEAVRKSR